MANLNIKFNDKNYQLDDATLATPTAELKSHFSTAMNGEGATINLGGTTYNIDSTKLSTATTDFVAHLGTIAGDGSKVVVGGVEYSVDATKVAGAIESLDTMFGSISEPMPSEGLAYTLNSDGVSYSVKNGTCTDTDVIIASEYEGLPVTCIGSSAFEGCSSLTSVVIPDSVTSIGGGAFYGCESLTSITIPYSVTSIDSHAFSNCSSLKNITIPDSVTSIGRSAFYGCSSLTSINFNGTIVQWNAITKDESWNVNVPATYVQCSDGQVAL